MSVELFAALGELATAAAREVRSVFDHFDGDNDGALTGQELLHLVQTLLPTTATVASLRYFQVSEKIQPAVKTTIAPGNRWPTGQGTTVVSWLHAHL